MLQFIKAPQLWQLSIYIETTRLQTAFTVLTPGGPGPHLPSPSRQAIVSSSTAGEGKPGKWQSNQANDLRMMVYAAKRKSGKPESNQANAKICMVYAALGPHWPIMIFQKISFAVPQTEKLLYRGTPHDHFFPKAVNFR